MGAVVAALALTTAAATARADDHGSWSITGTYFKFGVEAGDAFARDRGNDLFAGPVLSIVHINDDLLWYGLQTDVIVDGNGDADAGIRWSFGPELGKVLFGGDLSYTGERVSGTTYHGLAGRVKLTVGLAALFLRYSYLFDSPDANVVDVGIQLKLGYPLNEKKREDD